MIRTSFPFALSSSICVSTSSRAAALAASCVWREDTVPDRCCFSPSSSPIWLLRVFTLEENGKREKEKEGKKEVEEGKGEKKREKEDGRFSSGYKLSHPPSESERELSRSESEV